MKKFTLLLFMVASLLASCSNPTFKQEEISIIPKPVSFELKESSFRFESNTSVAILDISAQKAANYLVGKLKMAAGYNLDIETDAAVNGVVFKKVDMEPEAYQLEVTPEQIVITASDESGFFNGVQTIRQLLPSQIESMEKTKADWLVPCCVVEDAPRFSWRGMHMDFSRHFFDVEEVKEFLDYMSLYKLNTYHMHLTDDQGWRIEIKKYPLLTEKGAWRIENNQDTICNERAVENELYTIDPKNYREKDGKKEYGGFFTQEQIKEIITYADERCITVVPEIDMPGHFKAAIDNYLFLSCTGEAGWGRVFSTPACLGKETTYEFMENILAEVVELFPCKYVHIGGDEVRIESWEECPKCQKEIKKHHLADEHELQSHFNRRIEKFLQSKGKQLMGWDEIVEGGLSEGATMMWWRNWVPKAPRIAAENGNDMVITPTAAYYYDYLNDHNPIDRTYAYEPVPDDFTPEQTKHVLGIQANLWSEWIPSFKRLQYQAFPRLIPMAETAWTAKELKDFDDFNARIQHHYSRLDEMGVYYYIPAVKGLDKDIVFVDSVLVELNLAYPHNGAEIYYTLDGTVPTRNALRYTEPIVVSSEGEIKARTYKGEIFNDLITAKIERQSYQEASDYIPGNKGIKKYFLKGKYKSMDDIHVSDSSPYIQADTIQLGQYGEGTDFAIVYKGFLNADKDGIYEFEMKSDGESLLYLGNELVIDKATEERNPYKKYEKVALKKGWHAFTVKYLPSTKPKAIEVRYALQGEKLQGFNTAVCAY
ncbi:family 20 glycosylhydrolase [Saccharicrinis sp. 156]|uniref:family 20 glycosylhydrolase n=1 Tax=Saccharicrinis sp. 156 TaxID=3417574 RepID=UPI003D3334B2